MQFKTAMIVLLTGALGISGCTQMGGGMRQQDVGAISGGVLGGVLGSQVGHHHGRTAAIIGGTMLGAVLGGAIGQNMDEVDRMKMNQILETGPSNSPRAWVNPDTNVRYTVSPSSTSYVNGRPCREYIVNAMINGRMQKAYGTACRNSDGSWQIAS